MRHYEIMLLIHPDQSKQVKPMLERYQNMIEKGNGKIHRLEDLERRQLAYPINKIHKAHYVLLNIECGKDVLAELENAFRFNDAIIRSLFLARKEAIATPSQLMLAKADESRKMRTAGKQLTRNRHHIDYKDLELLKNFVVESGRILPARITGTSALHQRLVTNAVKQARYVALLAYCDRHDI